MRPAPRREHGELFEAYVAELRAARERALAWWQELETAELKDPCAAAGGDMLARRWPFGPASHPWVIAVYRKYYLACEQLNQRLAGAGEVRRVRPVEESDWGHDEDEPEPGPVPPRSLVVDQLETEATQDLHDFILQLPFVPIGAKNEELA